MALKNVARINENISEDETLWKELSKGHHGNMHQIEDDWQGEGIEGKYGGGVDPEIQGMYEFITEYGPLAGAAGATAVGLRALKSKAPRLMKWFSNFIKKGGTPKEAKLAKKLQNDVIYLKSDAHGNLSKWEKKVREIEKGWAKEKGVKMPKGVMKEWRQPLPSPLDDVSKEISPYLSVKGAAKAGSSRQQIQDFMGEALRKKPYATKGEVQKVNKWIDKNFPMGGRSQKEFSAELNKDLMEHYKAMGRVVRPSKPLRSGVMSIPPGRGPEGGKSIGRRIGEGAGILGIGSLVNYLADERMLAADERARQERGNIDPYPSPYKVDDVESRSNRERLLDRGSIKPAPAPRVNPLKYLIEEEGGFLE